MVKNESVGQAFVQDVLNDIPDDGLQHWGIKGMKWGRRRYQNKDGSLTPEGKKRYGDGGNDDSKEETPEQRRARVLKSTSAEELYNNRDVLTTNEIRERIDRINVEKQLGQMAESTRKTGLQRVEEVVNTAGRIYDITQKPVVKALLKKLGIGGSDKPKAFDLDKVYKTMNVMTDEQVKKAASRVENMDKIKKVYDASKQKAAKEEAKAEAKQESKAESTKKEKKAKTPKDEEPEIIFDPNEKSGKTGQKGEKWQKKSNSDTVIDADFVDLTPSDVKNTETAQYGRDFVMALLEEPK